MATGADIKYDEKAELVAAYGGGGVIPPSVDNETEDAARDTHHRVVSGEPVESPSKASTIIEPCHSASEGHEEEEGKQHQPDSDGLPDLEAAATTASSREPYTVFTLPQRRFIVFMAMWGGFFSAISANIYFPVLTTLADDFDVTPTLINLTLTSYMIFQGLAPTIIGDLSDMAGRRPAYIICFVIYIGANIGLSLCRNYASLFILRCLQSSGSSGTIALGTGVVADIAVSAERGTMLGWALAGPMIAPPLGPVLGGILAEYLGWRAIFWFLVIMAVTFLIPLVIFYPETGRNVVGNGSVQPQSWNVSLLSYLHARKAAKQQTELTRTVSRESSRREAARLAKRRKLRFPNPLHTLRIVKEKDVSLLLFYNSLIYTAFNDVTSTTSYLFTETYGFTVLQVGLCFIPFGVGALLAPMVNGRLLDWNFRRHARRLGIRIEANRSTDLKDFPIERARIEIAAPLIALGDASLLCYGWAMHVNAPLPGPLVLQFIMGLTICGSFNCLSVMLVDFYPLSPATATSANNFVRCLVGAAGTAVMIPMIEGMGRGWAFTLIAALVAAFSPVLWLLQKKGPEWREERRVRLSKVAEAKKEKDRLEEEAEDAQDANHAGREAVEEKT